MVDTKELQRLEALAEAAYSRMYNVTPLRSTKDDYDDACMYFQRAIDEAKRLGLTDDVERLAKRYENIRSVRNSQFRM